MLYLSTAGIGTYVAGEHSVNLGWWGKVKQWWTETIDLGLGTSFDQHVIAGYQFIMRYHEENDKIFIFGFSRGAFTARFLARMISTIGLLSKGNEEMVPFAYKTYQEYEMGTGRFKTCTDHKAYMGRFRATFCRENVKVHFLGLFDTVNSVGYFDAPFTKKTFLPSVIETATHVRYAGNSCSFFASNSVYLNWPAEDSRKLSTLFPLVLIAFGFFVHLPIFSFRNLINKKSFTDMLYPLTSVAANSSRPCFNKTR